METHKNNHLIGLLLNSKDEACNLGLNTISIRTTYYFYIYHREYIHSFGYVNKYVDLLLALRILLANMHISFYTEILSSRRCRVKVVG